MFLGPPGAGKGTMASRLALDKQLPHISTGDIIRAAIRDLTPIGREVKAIVENGQLVSDDITNALVAQRLQLADVQNGFILDGYSRTVAQAKTLDQLLILDRVINFDLPIEAIVKRLSGRRVHKPSGRTYHLQYNPPKIANRDDLTGEELWQRPDDQEDAIRTRLAVYQTQTQPLVAYYAAKNCLVTIDASPDTETVYRQLVGSIVKH